LSMYNLVNMPTEVNNPSTNIWTPEQSVMHISRTPWWSNPEIY
jgi:hypothetical protein